MPWRSWDIFIIYELLMGLARYEKHKVNGIMVNGVLMGLMGVRFKK